MGPNFIFYDHKKSRYPKVKRIFFSFFSLSFLLVFFVLFSFFYSPLVGQSTYKDLSTNILPIVDEISMREEGKIEVLGEGPFVSVENIEGENFITRKPMEGEKLLMLTFDDGPDPVFTARVLEILRKEDVKAIFFLIGKHLIRHPALAREIVDNGHLIGVHTYSHPYSDDNLYEGMSGFFNQANLEIDLTQKIIIAQTGIKTNLFRVPNWGAEDTVTTNSVVLTLIARQRGFQVISSTVDSFDWKETDPEKVISNSLIFNHNPVILLHDAGGDRNAMIEGLPEIIKRYRAQGYRLVAHEAFTGTLYTEANIFEKLFSGITYYVLWLRYNFFNLFKYVFISALGIIGITTLLTLTFALLHSVFKKYNKTTNFFPSVSIIVPAYNEESTIIKTVKSVLSSKYKGFEVLVVNNNSTDATHRLLKDFTRNHSIRVLNEKTPGKYAALNKGILHAKGEIIVIIDADTQLLPDTLYKLVQPFANEKVGAVSGSVHVGNVKNFLTYFQAIEYVVSLNLDRRAYDLFSSTAVIPGALGAWRKDLIVKAGFYTNDTLTEDAELAVKIQRLGYKTAYAAGAVGYTEAPESLTQFIKQRQRWTFGILQVLYKNRDMFFKRKYGFLGIILFPYMAYVQLPMMLLTPLFDVLSVIALIINPSQVAPFFVIFLVIKFSEVIIAFFLANEKRFSLLICVPYMRVIYQIFWYFNLYRCLYYAVKGEYVPWNKMIHIGTVEVEKAIA